MKHIKFVLANEPTLTAKLLRHVVLGPAKILDGIIFTLSLGYVSASFSLEIARLMAYQRMYAKADK